MAISAAVLALVGVLHLVTRHSSTRGVVDQLEWITYDARVKLASKFVDVRSLSPKLATLFIDDVSLQRINNGQLSPTFAANTNGVSSSQFTYKWPWPMYLHGQMIRELAAQGAVAVGYDILFPEQETSDCMPAIPFGEGWLSSEQFFLKELATASNVILATEGNVLPALPYQEASQMLGNIFSKSDHGVLRRVKPFTEIMEWHPKITELIRPLELEIHHADTSSKTQIIIPRRKTVEDLNPEPLMVRLNPNGSMEINSDGNLNMDPDEKKLGPDTEMPFRLKKVWNLGIVLASKALGLKLDKSEIYHDRLVLKGGAGLERIIELDPDGSFYIDWSITFEMLKSNKTPIYLGNVDEVLYNDYGRLAGETDLNDHFRGKVVLIGSTGAGNNIADIGTTPVESKTFLVTKHLNVANSILNGRFISRAHPLSALAVLLALGVISALVTWKARVVTASISVCFLSVGYVALAAVLYIHYRYWLDMVLPVGGGLILPHFALVSYRVMFEQKEQKRVKGIFTKIVSPDVVQELLSTDDLSLGGVRRRITVFFADVRGFTEFSDGAQAAAEEYIRKHNLTEEQAQAIFDQQAAETLATVNLYLGIISDMVKKHNGTLDKYIGDCVMAFWGAPVANEQHALCCVRAAMDAQRALCNLNQERSAENERRKHENIARSAEGKPPLPLLSLLSLGSGINTGYAVVGLMGSDSNIVNYTVFGREVNLASRLEGISGRGRIVIGEQTYLDLKRDDPTLAASMVELPPSMLKGFRQMVKTYEAPWKLPPRQSPGSGSDRLGTGKVNAERGELTAPATPGAA
ncbi:MAG: CHASE2 domain-containing protein [Verrucomicrobiales bacterium]